MTARIWGSVPTGWLHAGAMTYPTRSADAAARRLRRAWRLALRMRAHGDPPRIWRGAIVVIDGGRR